MLKLWTHQLSGVPCFFRAATEREKTRWFIVDPMIICQILVIAVISCLLVDAIINIQVPQELRIYLSRRR
jgi:hypothetical protein